MDIKEIKSDFIICDVPDHPKHKAILLDLIDKIPNTPYEEISKTDWNLPKTFERKYLEYFKLYDWFRYISITIVFSTFFAFYAHKLDKQKITESFFACKKSKPHSY